MHTFLSVQSIQSACTHQIILHILCLNFSLISFSPFYSVAKQQRTLTSSSLAPSPSSHHQMSWLLPTSTRPSLQGSLSSTHSLYTRRSTTAYEQDEETFLKITVHCHLLKSTKNLRSDYNLIKAYHKCLCISFINQQKFRACIFVLYNIFISMENMLHCFPATTRNNFL